MNNYMKNKKKKNIKKNVNNFIKILKILNKLKMIIMKK